MNGRTYGREAYLKAQAAWDDGEFGYRWQRIRRIAGDRGFIFPPLGSVHDDRDMDPPSQRAIIYRAIEDNPTAVEAIVSRASSWFDVVDRIIGLEARLTEEAGEAERDDAWRRKDEGDHRAAAMDLKLIIQRIADS